MKNINLFSRFVLSPLFILVNAVILSKVKEFNKLIIIFAILGEIILVLYMLNSYSYSSKYLQSKFLRSKKIYELNKITFVQKSNIGYVNFYFGSKYKKESINFFLQKKNKLELFEYIKKENPSCKFCI